MSSILSITTDQILNHRAARKAAGLVGCISGKPAPPINFFGYSDVQSWRPSDPMNPHCFCFDCRGLWDRDATIDLQLVQTGHRGALEVYGELLRNADLTGLLNEASPPSFRSYSARVPDVAPILMQRSNGGGISPPSLRVNTTQPTYSSFEEIPASLPAPRSATTVPPLPSPVLRSVATENPKERLRRDLMELKAHIYADLIPVMDRRRNYACMGEPELSTFIAQVDADEAKLYAKIAAIDLLLDE